MERPLLARSSPRFFSRKSPSYFRPTGSRFRPFGNESVFGVAAVPSS